MYATTWGITSWAMSMSSFGVKRMQSGQWLNSIIAGSTGRPCMLSCLLSPTSGSHAVGSMRWGNVPVVASATSCTCDPSPGISGGSSMGRDPSTGHPQGPRPTTVPKKETDDVHQTTGMAASEILAVLPSTLDRHRCSWPGLLFKAPLIPQGHLPQPLDLTAPPLIKFLY